MAARSRPQVMNTMQAMLQMVPTAPSAGRARRTASGSRALAPHTPTASMHSAAGFKKASATRAMCGWPSLRARRATAGPSSLWATAAAPAHSKRNKMAGRHCCQKERPNRLIKALLFSKWLAPCPGGAGPAAGKGNGVSLRAGFIVP